VTEMGEDVQIPQIYEKALKEQKTMESIVKLLAGYTFSEVVNILDCARYECSKLSVVRVKYKTEVKGLKKIRKERGLKILDLAKLSGVSRITISYLENGKTKRPTHGVLNALAKTLGCEIADIMEG
jgi:DNA-binding Xre family transcriptional regulator